MAKVVNIQRDVESCYKSELLKRITACTNKSVYYDAFEIPEITAVMKVEDPEEKPKIRIISLPNHDGVKIFNNSLI